MDFTGINEKPQPQVPIPVTGSLTPSLNPIRDNVRISYALDHSCLVAGAVYDAVGLRVANLGSSVQSAGNHQVAWNSSSVRPGIYIVKLITGNRTSELRLVKAD